MRKISRLNTKVTIIAVLGILVLPYIFLFPLLEQYSVSQGQHYFSKSSYNLEISNPSLSSDYVVSQDSSMTSAVRKRTSSSVPVSSLFFSIDINTNTIRIDVDTDKKAISLGKICFSGPNYHSNTFYSYVLEKAVGISFYCWESIKNEKGKEQFDLVDKHSGQLIKSAYTLHHLSLQTADDELSYSEFLRRGNDPYLVLSSHFVRLNRSNLKQGISESVLRVNSIIVLTFWTIAVIFLTCLILFSWSQVLGKFVETGRRAFGSSIFAHFLLVSIFVGLAVVANLFDLTPDHDAIKWHGIWHYFASSIQEGVVPLWNPYSLTGTPFYPDYQTLGLLVFTNLIVILFQVLSDSTTLTSYVNSYLCWYYIFVIGTYLSLRVITQDNRTSLFFTLVVMLSVFEMFARQNGALNTFVFVPFITYFLLLFSYEHNSHKKGLYFFSITVLLSISSLIYIPVGVIFHILFLVLLLFVFRTLYVRDIIQFLLSKPGLSWVALSMIVGVAICAPTFLGYLVLQKGTELIPVLKMTQIEGLIEGFVSDIDFQKYFSKRKYHSITSGDLAGLLMSTNVNLLFKKLSSGNLSEIFLSVGVLPLFFALRCLRPSLNPYGYIFFSLMILCLFIMTNFSTTNVDPLAVTQNIIISVVPFMKEYEVFQNFGALFIFYLVLAAAVGFKTFEKSSKTSRLIWVTLLFLPMANYTYLLFVDGDRRSLFTHLPLIAYFGYIFCLLGAALILVSAKSGKKLKSITLLKAATVVVVLAELVMVDLSYFEDRVGSHLAYKGILKSEGILYRKQEVSFLNYRDPVIGPSNLFSPGVFQARKTALPDGNYFYFTSDYYDYLLNISSAKQPATSSILYPILRFIPMDKVVFLRDKYAVVNAINQTSVGDLGKYIFIEGGTEVEKINSLLENRLNRDNNELELLENSQLPTHRVARIDVVEYGPNQLIVDVIALEDGYLFFGDGFHKHWKSFVDGENQTIHKTNVNFKSVFVPEGKHNVRFQFDPKAFKYAAVVSTFTQFTSILFILVTSWVLRGSRRRVGRRN